MKFEYPITAKYIRDWQPIDALREFGANALDAETQRGAKATITYDAKKKVVLFKNEGVTLSRETLLLGGTDKDDRSDTIGTYGEGMKMGFLVCSREGLLVNVRNGREEKWVPRIEYSEKWQGQILQLDVTTTKRQVENFEIEVIGVEMDLWEELQKRFLKLNPPTNAIHLTTGTIISDAEFVGRVYAKGVFVQHMPNYDYGYNFNGLELNRDRQFTSSADPHIAAIWRELIEERPDKLDELYRMISDGRPEGAAVRYYGGPKMVEAMADIFVREHPDVYIAKNTDEAREYEHYGITSVVVGPLLYDMLARKLPTFAKFREEHRYDTSKVYTFDELSEEERGVYIKAMDLLRFAGVIRRDELRVTVVDFVESRIRGLHSGDDIKISRKILKSLGRTLTYLIHEFAHDMGADGDKSHIDAMEEATIAVFDALQRMR
jgi:hypothetical protein